MAGPPPDQPHPLSTFIGMKLQSAEQEEICRSRTNDECPWPHIFPHSPQDKCQRGSAEGAPRSQSRWHLRLAQIVCTRAVPAENSCLSQRTIQPPRCNRTTRLLWHSQRCASLSHQNPKAVAVFIFKGICAKNAQKCGAPDCLVMPARWHQRVVALIDWRRLVPPCERQSGAVIAGWVRHPGSCRCSTRKLRSAACRNF
jgi:hypothetical protein